MPSRWSLPTPGTAVLVLFTHPAVDGIHGLVVSNLRFSGGGTKLNLPTIAARARARARRLNPGLEHICADCRIHPDQPIHDAGQIDASIPKIRTNEIV